MLSRFDSGSPVVPFDIGESELYQELQAYYQAIHSYPDRFAETRLSFHRHLLNIIGAGHEHSQGDAPQRLKSAS